MSILLERIGSGLNFFNPPKQDKNSPPPPPPERKKKPIRPVRAQQETRNLLFTNQPDDIQYLLMYKHRKKFKISMLGNGVFFIGIFLVYLWNK